MASFLRTPFGTLTSLRPPPLPGSLGFAAWKDHQARIEREIPLVVLSLRG